MSTANSGPRPSDPSLATGSPRKKSKAIYRFFWYALGLSVLLMLFWPFCRTTGKEFSPVKFQTREFTLYRVPGTDLQFLPTLYSPPSSAMTAPEILGNLKNISQVDIWHTAESDSYGGDSFPAMLLLRAIGRKDSENEYLWGNWSINHPNEAASLWPIIQSMAMANLYHEIPETLRFAEGFQKSDDPFETALLREIHRLVSQRKALFGSPGAGPGNAKSGNDKSGDFDSRSEGVPDWSEVQAWLQQNPVPDQP